MARDDANYLQRCWTWDIRRRHPLFPSSSIFKTSQNSVWRLEPSLYLPKILLKAVKTVWHHIMIDVLSTSGWGFLAPGVKIVEYNSRTVLAKLAQFDYLIPQIETETQVYQAIEGHRIRPEFIGHLVEHGRHGGIDDLGPCKVTVERLHSLGFVHRDTNRYNFIVSPESEVKLIDLECAKKGNAEDMQRELAQLPEKLANESGMGGMGSESSDPFGSDATQNDY
ncbi:hypothetical protein M422DRAFT_50757 [Sphaerobolus stellatus SS14]|uniref:Uncharacterized protein n=1 Tax=Sphaerobolus stellatus (strain SS14) TaxID=990650 RepID=A0A0C9UQH8_SPHS4|nr:hypothetical protein M422DRAFT_50757 [Sphaerobolus stellatus SS14]